MKRIYSVFLLFLSLLPGFLAAQTDDFQHQKDSLQRVIPTLKGKEKLKAMVNLSRMPFPDNEIEQTLFKYNADLLKEAQAQRDIEFQVVAMSDELTNYYNYNLPGQFEEKIEPFLKFAFQNGRWMHYYSAYQSWVEICIQQHRYEKALTQAHEMYNQAKKQNNDIGLSNATFLLGYIYINKKDRKQARPFFEECIERERQMPVKQWTSILEAYHNLAFALIRIDGEKDHAFALMKEYEKDLIKYEEANNTASEVLYTGMYKQNFYHAYLNLYIADKNIAAAERYCDSIQQFNFGDDRSTSMIMEARGDIEKLKGNDTKAYEYYKEGAELTRLSGNHLSSIAMQNEMARILSKEGKGDEAYSLFQRMNNLKDSIRDIETTFQLEDLRTQYEVDKHIAEKQRNRNNFLFALGGCILLAIALGIWMYYSRQILRKNRELVRKARQWANVESLPAIADADEETEPEALLPKTVEPDETDRLLFAEIEQLVDNGLYKDSSLSLDMLAGKTNRNPTYISKAVSRCTGKTFKTWLNEYRIKEAVRLLSDKDNPNISIETVAWDAGFNDRKTFHRIFKSTTGLSPTDFKKNGLRK